MIDLTLNSLLVPDILGYTPLFGQKVTTTPENKGGLSTQQVNDNILLPFATQRAVEVTTTDTTSKVERDARLVITGDNVTLTISSDAFAGCKLSIIALKDAVISINSSNTFLKIGDTKDVVFDGTKWVEVDKSMPIGSIYIQFSGQSDPTTLFGGTWQNISSTYAGRFFRAEGEDAAAFGSNQAEGLPNADGSWYTGFSRDGAPLILGRAAGVFSSSEVAPSTRTVDRGYQSGGGAQIAIGRFSLRSGNSIYGASDHVTPINTTIRIWKRTA